MLTNSAKLITHIKNATVANLNYTFVPYSEKNIIILQYFLNYKLIKGFIIYKNKNKILVFPEFLSSGYVSNLKLHSKPSLKKYTKLSDLIKLSKETYLGIISTSKGLKTLNEAIFEKTGGEVLIVTKYI